MVLLLYRFFFLFYRVCTRPYILNYLIFIICWTNAAPPIVLHIPSGILPHPGVAVWLLINYLVAFLVVGQLLRNSTSFWATDLIFCGFESYQRTIKPHIYYIQIQYIVSYVYYSKITYYKITYSIVYRATREGSKANQQLPSHLKL